MPAGGERDGSTTYDRVRASFGPNAAKYTHSVGHADRGALAHLVELVAPRAGDVVLDVGSGAGHTGLAFAPLVTRVVAVDLTRQMLEETRRNAAERGVGNVTVEQGAAEALPCASGSFDLALCRLTAHHFADLGTAVGELARVLRVGGRLVIVDTMVPEDDELDRQINTIERLRDPSHVRNCRPSEWRALLAEAGLAVQTMEVGYYDEARAMDVDAWTARIGTPPAGVTEIRRLFRSASPALAAALRIELAGEAIRFALPRLTVLAVK